ncbi:MAG TPA: bifunctional phosphoglucose/phosphomannose isomerase [Saprospiraceae bacterium]|nr:bifunctional phosphoglucose/phosphomannose isomerase [Saprospiraceae bacterium]
MTMLEMVDRFCDQLEEAIQIGSTALIDRCVKDPGQIYVAGMGGSGIGADLVSALTKTQLKVPYLVGKSYEAPHYINSQSIVVASSYSGNTEETLSCLEEVKKKGSRIIVISSGGELLKQAKENKWEYIQLPSDWPSPRACLSYSVVAQLYMLFHLGLIKDNFVGELRNSIQRLRSEKDEIKEKAAHLANALFEKNAVIYSTDQFEPVAVRFRQQINENAKRLCWHHTIPEMNHNELVGWRKNDPKLAVLFLRSSSDHPRNIVRMDLTKEIASHYAGACIELFAKGDSFLERVFYLIHLTDYISVFLADLNKVDAVEVKVIDFLKQELAKV